MATKTNTTINGKKYFRVSASFGTNADGKLIRKYFYGKSEKEARKKMEEYKLSLREGLALDIVDTFLETEFSNDERHIRRINMIED